MAMSWINIHRAYKAKENWAFKSQVIRHSPERPLISIIIPAFNESKVIRQTILNYRKLDYDRIEIIVVDDGSHDETTDLLRRTFRLVEAPISLRGMINHYSGKMGHIYLRVIKVRNGGKASAMNAGLRWAEGEFVITADADTVAAPQSILQMLDAFQDPDVMAVGGAVKVLNSGEALPNRALLIYQVLEYMRAFYCGRIGWDFIQGTTLLSGAYSMFRRSALIRVSGYNKQSITEDLEIIVRMKRLYELENRACKVVLLPYPVCWTEVPENLRHLFNQRLRWQRGLLRTLKEYRKMIGDKNLKNSGMVVMPYMLIFEASGPLMELFAYIFVITGLAMGIISWQVLVAVLAGGLSYSFIYTSIALLVEQYYFFVKKITLRDLFKVLWFTTLENIGFRQLLWLGRLMAYDTLFAKSASWGAKERYTSLAEIIPD